MKKILTLTALSALFCSQHAAAMITDKDDTDFKMPKTTSSKLNQEEYQKTDFDIECEKKFAEERDRLEKIAKRVEKRLGLDKAKKKAAKHLK